MRSEIHPEYRTVAFQDTSEGTTFLIPSTAESAISAMFDFDDPDGFPTVQSDEDAQQLLIRATKPQIEQIRQLLTKMGSQSRSTMK